MKSKLLALICLVVITLAGVRVWQHSRRAGTLSGNAAKPSKAQQSNQSTFNKNKYSVDRPDSLWVVVNKKRPLYPLQYAPGDLMPVGNGQQLRAEAAGAFNRLTNDAKTAGYNLIAESGYRSYRTQVAVYNREVQTFGRATADTQSARPGYSEHQTGWAIDIGSAGCYEDCFGKTAAAGWLKDNAYLYGFLLRYPADKSPVTGYRNEPWHFRYVGKELSAEIHSRAITTLEEFFSLPAAPNY